MFKRIAVIMIVAAVLATPALALEGPQRSKVQTTSSQITKFNLNSIKAGVPGGNIKYSTYVSCADDAFQVLAWKYTGTGFVLTNPTVAADTLSSGSLANTFVRIDGKYDFLVVKTATVDADISFQTYLE